MKYNSTSTQPIQQTLHRSLKTSKSEGIYSVQRQLHLEYATTLSGVLEQLLTF